jgi:hypothetical protein
MVVGSFKVILTPMENIMVARDLIGDRKMK